MSNCSQCMYAVFEDYGYSNYTVEGTSFSCGNRLHPDGVFDRFYNTSPKLEYANQCSSFIEGEAIYMDVECEGIADLTPEQRKIYEAAE